MQGKGVVVRARVGRRWLAGFVVGLVAAATTVTHVPVASADDRTGGAIARDELGNPLGGLRLPAIDVPTAAYNNGAECEILQGRTDPFREERLRQLYPTKGAYLSAVAHTTATAKSKGYLLEAGAGNVPYKIAGKCVANLLSFYYHTAYRLEGGALTADNVRSRGCTPPPPEVLDVPIDVKPGDDTNPINTKGSGSVPVAILWTAAFDPVLRVDQPSLRFGKTGTEASLLFREGRPQCEARDVNGDGHADLVCQYDNAKLGYTSDEGTTSAVLTGRTTDIIQPTTIRGEDTVRVR